MKNKKIFSSLLFSVVALIPSCTTTKPVHESGVKVKLAPREYEILGRVVYQGRRHNVLGLFDWGGAAYHKLYEKAKNEFGADDVINISVDYRTWHIGVIYNQRTYIMTGIAIKYKK